MTLLAIIPAGVVLALQLIIVAAGVILAARARKRRGRRDGFAADRENAQDPAEPIRVPYGAGLFAPPKLTRYPIPQALDSLKISRTAEAVELHHVGYGEIDGGGFKCYVDGRPTQTAVTEQDPTSHRLLFPVTDDRRTWRFPVLGVIESTVSLYLDGVLYASNHEGLGLIEENIVDETLTLEPAFFRAPKDGNALIEIQRALTVAGDAIGVFEPDSSITGRTVHVVPPGGKPVLIDPASIHFGETKAGTFGKFTVGPKRVLWFKAEGGRSPQVAWADGTKVRVTYRYVRALHVERAADGTCTVTFPAPIADGAEVSFTGDASNVDPEQMAQPVLFRGAPDDKPIDLPFYSGYPRTYTVDRTLEPATPETYLGHNETDDIVVELQAPSGLFRQASSGVGGVSVEVQFRVKESAADDVSSPDGDPANGWVTLKHPAGRMWLDGGKQVAPGSWHFSIARLLAFTRTGTMPAPGARLPRRVRYDVQAARLTPAGADTTSDDIDLAQATEVVYVTVRFPGQAVLVTHWKDAGLVSRNPLVEVEARWLRVIVPSSSAAVAVEEFGSWTVEPAVERWTRNPVWLACDFVAHNGYNAGRRRDGKWNWSRIDVPSMVEAAAFCDETVEGRTRSEADIVLDERRTLKEDVSDILAGSGVQFIERDGKMYALIDRPSAPVDSIGEDDVEAGESRIAGQPVEEIPTALEVVYPDETQRYEDRPILLVPLALGTGQRIVRRVEMRAVRRRWQAERMGRLALAQAARWTRAVEMLAAGWRLIVRKIGECVTLELPDLGASGRFKIAAAEIDSDLRFKLEFADADPAVYDEDLQIPVQVIVPALKPAPKASANVPVVSSSPAAKAETKALAATTAGASGTAALSVSYDFAVPDFTVEKIG